MADFEMNIQTKDCSVKAAHDGQPRRRLVDYVVPSAGTSQLFVMIMSAMSFLSGFVVLFNAPPTDNIGDLLRILEGITFFLLGFAMIIGSSEVKLEVLSAAIPLIAIIIGLVSSRFYRSLRLFKANQFSSYILLQDDPLQR